MARPFVHLHTHSDHTMLDGMAKVAELVEAAAKFEQPALALTDHGNMCGAIELVRRCRDAGLKPIVGLGPYLAPRSRHDRERNPVAGHHLNLLAMNEQGYRNLLALSSKGFTEGFYYIPRVDAELLAAHAEGLVCTSACLFAGEPGHYAQAGDRAGVERAIGRMRDVFGDRYYVEIQRTGASGEAAIGEMLLDVALGAGVPVVATQGARYLSPEDAEAHEVHVCIGQGRTLADRRRRRQERGEQAGILSFDDSPTMAARFRDMEFALDATIEIADRCDLVLPEAYHLPRYEPPPGHDDVGWFRHLCLQGAQARYGTPLPDAVAERLAYEQGVIERMGFVPYFLITWDFVDYAKRNGIPVGPGRGSAAGSIVSYALGITTVDPLAYDLLFERFLNPDRISMPDIDIDFCKDGREQVIRYVQDKYGGAECVSHIITFGRMAARAVIRDVGRVLEVPLPDVDRLAKKIPNGPGASLEGALESDPDLRKEIDANPAYRGLVDIARRLEGRIRNPGKHAAGIVVSDGPLTQHVPLYRVGDDLTTQYSMDLLEDKLVGLLKMDFLGLRTLTIIAKAIELIERSGKAPPDVEKLPLDDPATYEMLSAGEALGVFQVEGSGMRELLRRIHPESFDDLATITALYRPGPMNSGMMDMYIERKAGRQAVTYAHPSLEPILRETRGVVVYQEQVMRIANVLGGFSLADADKLRKAMGKKKPELLVPYRARFIEGCVERSFAKDQAETLWDQLAEFAAYGFNKSHTVAYGLIAYQTAWLKRHHPKEFMAGLLTCEMADMDKLSEYIEEARRMGIHVLPPDVSKSDWEFLVEGDDIRYGLSAVKGVGRSAAEEIVASRPDDGYRDLYDLCERVDASRVNRATLEALVRAGALDRPGVHRAQLHAALERALARGAEAAADRAARQSSLFGFGGGDAADEAAADWPDVEPWTERDLLAREREAIGYYATNHPLAAHERRLRVLAGVSTADLRDVGERTPVRLGGMIRGLRLALVKRGRNEGRRMAFFDLEDFTGRVECVCFARTYAEVESLLAEDRIVIVEGKAEPGEESVSLHVDGVIPIEDAPLKLARGVLLRLRRTETGDLERLRSRLVAHSGPLPLVLEFAADPSTRARVRAGPAWAVQPSEALLEALGAADEVEGVELLASDV
ncbi:MAG: DNA polymerase III subunit alpha [Planctomycetes bacterium]|nr:DNA polymerase III subunit alpha [Planctomycetota bacterium]MCB9825605.1 DNA polymerase III subunit alpha [Planctomycetota bacterium]MCB9829742.1 DNA polymerase III subunit alpha [Planctomycetota bacterium]MCB9902354.1 DNA polymerase III subunit alpha [Planctomycetota bacterium]